MSDGSSWMEAPADDVPILIAGKNGGTLRPFRAGDPRASAAGRKGVATRRAKRVAAPLEPWSPAWMAEVEFTLERVDLASLAAAAAMHMVNEVVEGRQKLRDPAGCVRVLVDIARLEEGRATSLTASVQTRVTADDVRRAVELRDVARRALVADSGDDFSWRGACDATEVLDVDGGVR